MQEMKKAARGAPFALNRLGATSSSRSRRHRRASARRRPWPVAGQPRPSPRRSSVSAERRTLRRFFPTAALSRAAATGPGFLDSLPSFISCPPPWPDVHVFRREELPVSTHARRIIHNGDETGWHGRAVDLAIRTVGLSACHISSA